MDKATKRILELARKGLSDTKIAEKLAVEGFKNEKGGAFDRNSVHSRRLRAQPKLTNKTPASDISEISEKPLAISEESAISEHAQLLPEEWKSQIVQIVRQEIQAAVESQTLPKDQIELPPLPAKVAGPHGKPIGEGKRVKLAGTTDAELARRLESWRKERGITLSRALDAALWNFLGRPPMSFEISETSDN